MLSNVSKKLACLVFAGVMLGVAVAEAGTIPTSSVPLYTYATKKIYCYNSPGGAQKGYIDPGDDITITKVQSNGWVYGNYPTSKGRVSRWFKASDLLADRNANYTRYAPKATTTVYRDSSYRSSMGSVNNNETITVVGGSGNSRQIIYKLSNGKGYKMGWFPYWDALTYEQAFGGNTPKPVPVSNWDSNVNKKLANVNGSSYRSSNNPFYPRYVGQCTWYAWGRMKEVTGKAIKFSRSSNRHAKYWDGIVTNCRIDKNLESKCVAVRKTGGGGYGHVVFVENVSNGYVYYTEDNVDSSTNLKVRKTTVANFKKNYKDFIH